MRDLVRCVRRGDGALDVDLAPGSLAFVDASSDEEELVGRLYAATTDIERRAAKELAATAREAAALVDGGPGEVEVVGNGALAALVRMALPPAGQGPQRGAPAAVIDASGAPACIADAVGRVAMMGTVVLASPPLLAELELRTFADLHIRGLTLVGVPWASDPSADTASSALVAWALDNLAEIQPGGRAPASPWYCVRVR